ncbi:hypothetical protein AFLA_000489 [Aspergillus flavus NRRL3357]|nr:hypothetical protein AFLA_000489 [Aspergillus flavus NRRL3357]
MASSPDVIGPRPSCVMQRRSSALGVGRSAPSRIHRKSDARTARETGKATAYFLNDFFLKRRPASFPFGNLARGGKFFGRPNEFYCLALTPYASHSCPIVDRKVHLACRTVSTSQ